MKNCDIFLIFAQNIDRGYSFDGSNEAVLTSTRDLYFRAKIIRRKMNTSACNPREGVMQYRYR